MLNPLRKLVLAASLGAGIASFASIASALPVLDALAIRNAAPAPGYAAPPGASAGDPVAYCTQRYRSYNPQTGTYLGTDGQRHHCP